MGNIRVSQVKGIEEMKRKIGWQDISTSYVPSSFLVDKHYLIFNFSTILSEEAPRLTRFGSYYLMFLSKPLGFDAP